MKNGRGAAPQAPPGEIHGNVGEVRRRRRLKMKSGPAHLRTETLKICPGPPQGGGHSGGGIGESAAPQAPPRRPSENRGIAASQALTFQNNRGVCFTLLPVLQPPCWWVATFPCPPDPNATGPRVYHRWDPLRASAARDAQKQHILVIPIPKCINYAPNSIAEKPLRVSEDAAPKIRIFRAHARSNSRLLLLVEVRTRWRGSLVRPDGRLLWETFADDASLGRSRLHTRRCWPGHWSGST
eukprot:gene9506-biopygen4711